jgi:ribonuclease P protein component
MADARFLPAYRLRKKAEYDQVFGRRCSASDAVLVVYARENGLPHPRLGMVVSRRLGNAVARNRWRRLLREAFRLNRPRLPPDVDLVIVPRPGFRPQLAALGDSLVNLAATASRRLKRSRT